MMRRLFVFLGFLFLFVLSPRIVHASDAGYLINSFKSDISLQKDTSLVITDTLNVSFTAQKHGIIRVIPYIYSADGQTINARMQVLSITDTLGKSYQYQESQLGQSKKLQIGDPNRYADKDMTYIIKYKMQNIILKYEGKPEIYWNVTGHEWDTTITKVETKVYSDFADITNVTCYEGAIGTKNPCGNSFTNKNALFSSKSPILPGQDFTIVVGLAEVNSLVFPSAAVKAVDNWGYIPALFPFLLIILLWYWKGRDKKYVGDSIYYKPDKPQEEAVALFTRKYLPLVYAPINDLTPAEIGTIADEKVDIHDVIAEIVELARLKYLKILKVKDKKLFSEAEYAFIKLKTWEDDNKLRDYQIAILKKIFGISGKIDKKTEKILSGLGVDTTNEKQKVILLSSLKEHFFEALPEIKKKLYAGLKNKEIFASNPDSTRKIWISGYIFVSLVFGFITLTFAVSTFNFVPLLVGLVTFVAGIPFTLSMPRKTAWGYSLSRQIVGLKNYLQIGKWREEFMEKKLFFDEMIPLSISLGVVEKLASDMKDLGIEPPSYFANTTNTVFYSDIISFQRTLSYALVVGPGKTWSGSSSWSGHSSWSGGSGFSGGSSGGGFGGGGGGSW
jgi:uncharacterized membrane protein YgcG